MAMAHNNPLKEEKKDDITIPSSVKKFDQFTVLSSDEKFPHATSQFWIYKKIKHPAKKWIIKTSTDPLAEVLMQNSLYILLDSKKERVQPKARILISKEGYHHFLIEMLEEVEVLAAVENFRDRAETGEFSRLASGAFLCFLFNEGDRHTYNILINRKKQMIQIDCGTHAFTKDEAYDITLEAIRKLPYIEKFAIKSKKIKPFNWFSLHQYKKDKRCAERDEKQSLVSLEQSDRPENILSIHQAAMRMIVWHDNLIEKFIRTFTHNPTEINYYVTFYRTIKQELFSVEY